MQNLGFLKRSQAIAGGELKGLGFRVAVTM